MIKWLVLLVTTILVLYWTRVMLPPFVVAAVLAYIISPPITTLAQHTHLPRFAVVLFIYVTVLVLLGVGAWLLETRIILEVNALAQAGPNIVETVFVRLLGSETTEFLGQPISAMAMAEQVNSLMTDVMGSPVAAIPVAAQALETIAQGLLVLLVLLYLLLDGQRAGPYLLRFVPDDRRAQVSELARRVHVVFGKYLRGQLILITGMSLVSFLLLAFVFHLPYALPLGMLTGVLEIVPLLGPLVAAVAVAVVALSDQGLPVALEVAAAYMVLRQLEDQLVMPGVLGRALDLHPLITMFAVLGAGATLGLLGAILAVPFAAAVKVILDYFFPDSTPLDRMGEAETNGR